MNTTVKRSIFGVLFLAVMIAGLLMNKFFFGALLLFMQTGMLWEFFQMNMGQQYKLSRMLALVLGACLFCSIFAVCAFGLPFKIVALNLLLLIALPISTILVKDHTHFRSTAYLYTGLLYIAIPLSLVNLVVFRDGQFDGRLILAFFCIIWASDVGAYCFGMLFGQKGGRKLCPSISPKKSWAGFWGGMAMAMAAGAILYYTKLFSFPLVHCLIMAALMHVAGVFGDLYESLWKRACDIKDSGNLIPGHGGLMDRFDSALFAIPTGVLYLLIIGLM